MSSADLVVPGIPPTDALHNWLKLVRNAAVEGMVPGHNAAELVQTSAYMALVYYEECSRVEQELRALPAPIPGKMPKPMEV